MDSQEDKELDEALKRARAAFAGKTDDEIMDEVAEVIDEMRAAHRQATLAPTSA